MSDRCEPPPELREGRPAMREALTVLGVLG
jgi:hypothetical protein